MKKVLPYIFLLLLISMLLSACGGSEQSAPPPSASATARKLTTDQAEIIDLVDADIHSLSPRGDTFLVIEGSNYCLYEVENLSKNVCVDTVDLMLDSFWLSWAPDGSKIALTEMVFEQEESDLWLIDFDKEVLTNLTDDDIEGSFTPYLEQRNGINWKTDPIYVDYLPTFSSDGKNLAFARFTMTKTEWEGTGVYTIPVNGGEPEMLFGIHSPLPALIEHNIYFTKNDEEVVFVYENEEDLDQTGVWKVVVENTQAGPILNPEIGEENVIRLLGVTPDGSKALLIYPNILSRSFNEPNVCAYFILDTADGSLTSIKEPANPDEFEYLTVVTAALSPDGSKLAYIYLSKENQFVLAIKDLNGTDEYILDSQEEPFGLSNYSLSAINWGGNDNLFVSSDMIDGYLYKLEVKN